MLAQGTLLQGRYRILRKLSQGGMGTVYEAVDERLETRVALKENHFRDDQLIRQFEREARLLARLRHPSLTKVIDHFTEAQGQFLVMEFITGEDLAAMLERRGGPFPVVDVLSWGDQLLDALEYLHSQNPPVVHRDIKPQNLKLTDRDQIILLDFGLAKGYASASASGTTSSSVFGYTPNYAPLEQIESQGTDARSDLYSAAATLYHLITGASPPGALSRVSATAEGQADPLRRADLLNVLVPPGVAKAIEHAMSIGRSKRPASASEFRKLLRPGAKGARSAVPKNQKPTVVDPAVAKPPPTVPSPTQETTKVRPKGKKRATGEEEKPPTRFQRPITTLVAEKRPQLEVAIPPTVAGQRPEKNMKAITGLVVLLALGAAIAYYSMSSGDQSNEKTTMRAASPTPQATTSQVATSPPDRPGPYTPPAPVLGPATGETKAHDPNEMWCNFENPYAREQPSASSRTIGRCDCGHVARILARQAGWARIAFYDWDGSPAQGWVPTSTLNDYSHCP
jgi:serine/threonine protein kinase